MDYLFGRKKQHQLLKPFSVNELFLLLSAYKGLFKEQLRMPTAENNHILNYNLKF